MEAAAGIQRVLIARRQPKAARNQPEAARRRQEAARGGQEAETSVPRRQEHSDPHEVPHISATKGAVVTQSWKRVGNMLEFGAMGCILIVEWRLR